MQQNSKGDRRGSPFQPNTVYGLCPKRRKTLHSLNSSQTDLRDSSKKSMPQKVSAKQLYVHLPSSQNHGETCHQHSKNRQQRSESLRSLGSFEPSCFMRRSCRRLSDRGHATRKLLSHRSLRHKSRERGRESERKGEGERESTKAPYVLTSVQKTSLCLWFMLRVWSGKLLHLIANLTPKIWQTQNEIRLSHFLPTAAVDAFPRQFLRHLSDIHPQIELEVVVNSPSG